jgi:hypothetical protein
LYKKNIFVEFREKRVEPRASEVEATRACDGKNKRECGETNKDRFRRL